MAPIDQEEVEYESDPEEVKRSLTMRRKEASDDEDDEGVRGDHDARRGNQRAEIHSDESDGQGGVAEYDNDEAELGIVGEEGEDSYDGEEEDLEEDDDEEVDDDGEYFVGNEKRSVAGRSEGKLLKAMEVDRRDGETAIEDHAADHMDEEEKKEKEPFTVPTAGAFYMHDDRFQENPGGRHRRMRGGRKLWESRDDRKWGHDKFEEMNKQEKQYERKRTSRGSFGGRGRGWGLKSGYVRGNSSKAFKSNGIQSQFPKVVTRGRGPRRYETVMRNGNLAPSAQNRQSRDSFEKISRHDIGHAPTSIASSETDAIQAIKNVVASSLNSASPPFYPSGSSNNLTQNDIKVGMGRLHINESTSATGKNPGNAKVSSSGSSLVCTIQSSQSVGQGRGVHAPAQVMFRQSLNQVDRVSSPMHLHSVPRGSVRGCIEPSVQTSDQQSAVIRSLASPPPKTSPSKNCSTSDDMESASETVVKGKGSLQAGGGGSFLYGGTQVMGPAGSLAVGHGNPNFPALLPLMQFGGQPGGVPTFGMAFPGYVAQSEHGLGNSEMTWLPILAGPGALGAIYCSSYAPVEGSFQARKPGLPSSMGSSSKENNTSKPNNELKPLDRPELTINEIPQRQSNQNKQLRRYSEMSFSK